MHSVVIITVYSRYYITNIWHRKIKQAISRSIRRFADLHDDKLENLGGTLSLKILLKVISWIFLKKKVQTHTFRVTTSQCPVSSLVSFYASRLFFEYLLRDRFVSKLGLTPNISVTETALSHANANLPHQRGQFA